MDLATVYYGSSLVDSISILMGNGLGSFSAPTSFSGAGGSQAYCIINTDFNGDGKNDLATANWLTSNVSIFINDGSGVFNSVSNFTTGIGTYPTALISADFNGDGKKDLATANTATQNVSVLLGNGAGSFSSPTMFNAGDFPVAIISADFNGDGKMDLATANKDDDSISILIGNGLGNFNNPVNFLVGWDPVSINSADYNGDGKLDIASCNTNSANVSILLGNGLGSFSLPYNFSVSTGARCIMSEDFNGDSKTDIATASDDSGNRNTSILINGAFPAAIHDVNIKDQTSISIYPNPISGEFILELQKPANIVDIEIYNCLGDLVYKRSSASQCNSINLTGQAKGIYLVKVMSEGKVIASQKLSKN